MGNNREVARLYSERLGYTVNESTVRGIKKRYLEVTPMFHLSVTEATMMLFFPQFFFSFSMFPSFHISFFSYFPLFIFPPPGCAQGQNQLPWSLPTSLRRGGEQQGGRGGGGGRGRGKCSARIYFVFPSFHISFLYI